MSIDRTVGVGGVTIGLIGTGIVVLWPDKRWLGWVFIGLGLLIAVLSIVWALAEWHARKEFEARPSPASIPTPQITQNAQISPNINITPVFAPNFNQSQTQEQSQTQTIAEEKPKPSPEVECTDCYFTDGIVSGSNRLVDAHYIGQETERCKVAQADFYLKPIAGTAPWVELRTQLVFWDTNATNRLKRVSDGVWREQGSHIQMPLNTTDTRRLVIALALAKTGFNSYEYAQQPLRRRMYTTSGGVRTHTLAPKVEPLNAKAFTVQVFLVGKYLDEAILNQEFWFSVSFSESEREFSIKQIQSQRGVETDMKMQS